MTLATTYLSQCQLVLSDGGRLLINTGNIFPAGVAGDDSGFLQVWLSL